MLFLALQLQIEFPSISQPFDLSEYLTKIINSTHYTPTNEYQLNEIEEQIQAKYNAIRTFLDGLDIQRQFVCENGSFLAPQPEYLNFAYYTDISMALCQRFTEDQRADINFLEGEPLPVELYNGDTNEHFSELVLWQYDNMMYQWPYFPSKNNMFNQRVKKYIFTLNVTIYFEDGVNFLLHLLDGISPLSYIQIICIQNDSVLYDGLAGNYDPGAVLHERNLDEVVNIDRMIHAINRAHNENFIILCKGIEYSILLSKGDNSVYLINTYLSAIDKYTSNNGAQRVERIRNGVSNIYQFASKFNVTIYQENTKQFYIGRDSVHDESNTIKRILADILKSFATREVFITPPIYTNDVLVKQYVNFIVKPLFDKEDFIGYTAISFRIGETIDDLCIQYPALLTGDFIMLENDYLIFFSGSQSKQGAEYFHYLRNIPRNESYYELEQRIYNSTRQNYFFYEYRIARQIMHLNDLYVNNKPIKNYLEKQHTVIQGDVQKYIQMKGSYLNVGYTNLSRVTLFNIAKPPMRMVLILNSLHYNDDEFSNSRFGIYKHSDKILNVNCAELGLGPDCLSNAAKNVQLNIPYQLLTLRYANGSGIKYINYYNLLNKAVGSNCSMDDIIELGESGFTCQISGERVVFTISDNIRYIIKELLLFWTLASENMQSDKEISQSLLINITHYRISLQHASEFCFFMYDGNSPQALTSFQTVQTVENLILEPYCTASSSEFQSLKTQVYVNVPDINVRNLSYANLNNSFDYIIYNIMNINQNYSFMTASIKYSHYQMLARVYEASPRNFIVFNSFGKVIFTPIFETTQQIFRLQRQSFLSQTVCQNSKISLALLQRLFLENSLRISFYTTGGAFCLEYSVVGLSASYGVIPNTDLRILQLDWGDIEPYLRLEEIQCFSNLSALNSYVGQHFRATRQYIGVQHEFAFDYVKQGCEFSEVEGSGGAFSSHRDRIGAILLLMALFLAGAAVFVFC